MKTFRRFLLTLLLLWPVGALAVEPGEILADPALEHRARELSAELRCLVCQNQSIDDSQAPLAKDLRMIVRERLVAGDSDDSIRTYLVARYGDFVLLKPPFKVTTLLLWLSPLLVLLAGGLAVLMSMRSRRAASGAGAGLSDAERAKLAHILDRDGGASA